MPSKSRYFFILFVMGFMSPVFLLAQTEIPSFIKIDSNAIQLYGNKKGLDSYFKKLDSILNYGKGKLNILHIGGSHVQAGVLSGAMRSHFNNILPGVGGSRGFFFPFTLAKTNNPFHYKTKYTGSWTGCKCAKKSESCLWGLSGTNATTSSEGATVTIYAKDSSGYNYSFNKVRIFHIQDLSSFSITIDSSLTVTNQHVNAEAGYTEFQFNSAYDTLKFALTKTDSTQGYFTLQGIQYIDDQEGISYHAVGVNGASVPSYLRCELFEAQLKTIAPDLVIFGIGINDAYGPSKNFSQTKFENNYQLLINQFKNANPNVALLFLTNNDSYYKRRYPNRNALRVVKAMQHLAEKNNGAVWDLFEIMGGLNSIKLWEKAGLAKQDKIHFTKKGYVLQATLMNMALYSAFGNYLTLEP